MKFKIFLSSTIREFENERKYVKTEIENDSVLNNFFEVFSFEETSASGKDPVELYSHEVINSDIYIGLIGSDYGNILESGISPTEYEYDLFNKAHNDALIFVKNRETREQQVYEFIDKIGEEHTYQTFNDLYELFDEVRKSLINFLKKNMVNFRAYDSQLLLDSSCDDVDLDAVELFFKKTKNQALKELKENKGLAHVLYSIKAGEYVDDEFKLNVAGALFFAKDLSKFNIVHEIKMVKFLNSNDIDDVVKINSNQTLLKLLVEVEEFFFKHTKHVNHIKGFESDSIDEYPFKAIREAVVNAIAHRDYTITSSPISFYIFDNRIEIKSPGRLEYPLKVSELENYGAIHRNEAICSIFSHTNYMEHIGTGIKRMRNEMINNGLEEPDFAEIGEFFKVTFVGKDFENKYKGLNERQVSFMESEINMITISEYMVKFGVSRNTTIRDFDNLIKLNHVTKFKKGNVNIFKKN